MTNTEETGSLSLDLDLVEHRLQDLNLWISDVVKNAPEHGGQVMYRPGSHRGGCGTWAEDVAADLSALIEDNAALVAEVRRLRKHAEQEDSE